MAIKNVTSSKSTPFKKTPVVKESKYDVSEAISLVGTIVGVWLNQEPNDDGIVSNRIGISISIENEYYVLNLFKDEDVCKRFIEKHAKASYIGSTISVYCKVKTSCSTGKKYIQLVDKTRCPAGVKSLVITRPEYEFELG